MPGHSFAAGFPTTCWGRILQAGDPAAPEARAALEGLCRDYRLSPDAMNAETRFGGEPAHDLTAERLFERRWALTLLDHILGGLDAEMAHPDRRPLYERLRPGLLGYDDVPSYKTIALELGLTEAAVKMAAHRLRARYRERLRDEIARTVADPSEIDDEIRALLEALAR